MRLSKAASLERFAERCALSPDGKAEILVKIFDENEDGLRHEESPWLDPETVLGEPLAVWMREQARLREERDQAKREKSGLWE